MKEEKGGESENILDKYFEEQPDYSTITSHRIGKKYQTSVRFSGPVISELEKVSDRTGLSLAEVVRRFVDIAMEEKYNG